MKTEMVTSVLLIASNDEDIERVRSSLVEHYPTDAETFEFRRATTLAEGIRLLATTSFDLVISDLSLPDAEGLMVFATLYAQAPELPIVVLVDSTAELLALKAVQHGAQDYILKDQVYSGLVARTAQHAIQYRATEEALARERERLAVTLRSIEEGIITTDTMGMVSLINRKAEELTGWTQEEGSGLPLGQIFNTIDEETQKPYQTPLKTLLAGRSITELGTAILIDREGRHHLIEMTGAPLRDPEGSIGGAVLAFRDVTTQRQLQEERLRADKLEAIGKLAGGIAHDFNNLLVGILGNLSLARAESGTAPDLDQLLSLAESSALEAKRLALQLLTFASGGAPIRSTTTVEQLLAETIRLALSGSNLRAELTVDPEIWPVEIDENQFTQALTILIDNARLAMPDGGVIRVRCENLDQERPYLGITIDDEGEGIAADHLPQIFDPYFTTREGATGLGLAIAHSIITRHEGRIRARSAPGSGTTFQILLPAITAPVDQVGTIPGETRGPDAPLRILLMDDDEMVRRVACRMLEVLGHRVETAEDGDQAIQHHHEARLDGDPFDLIIMDLTIPGAMGGREAMRRIREVDQVTRSIVSSGYFNDPVMASHTEYGFDGVIAKPYQLDDLRTVIERVIQVDRRVISKP